MAGQPLATGQYEFSGIEEQQIAQTGKRAKIWGYISIALGVIITLLAVLVLIAGAALATKIGPQGAVVAAAAIAMGPMGLVYLVMGWFTSARAGAWPTSRRPRVATSSI